MHEAPDYCDLHFPLIEDDPFDLARRTCREAVQAAPDVTIDQAELLRFAVALDAQAVAQVAEGHMGENCDIGPDHFCDGREAANVAVLFGLLQFGHGFRYPLHELCGRGASKTITLGVTNLRRDGLSANRLGAIGIREVRELFELPQHHSLDTLTGQLCAVLRQAGNTLQRLGTPDFDSLCRRILATESATTRPAATLVRGLANTFPAMNDQGVLRGGLRVVYLKKATLAAGELARVAARHEKLYAFSDLRRAIAPMDNVIPAVLVYHKVLRLSDTLFSSIHEKREPLPRGPQECELRAAGLVACERLVEAAGGAFTALDLGYYLWLAGKRPEIRRFARHHTKDTVFY